MQGRDEQNPGTLDNYYTRCNQVKLFTVYNGKMEKKWFDHMAPPSKQLLFCTW